MPPYVAFLRAINVGGHTVKMEKLRELFESLGYEVATFLRSDAEVTVVARYQAFKNSELKAAGRQSDSKFSNAVFEKKSKMPATFRGMNTVAKLSAKYPTD